MAIRILHCGTSVENYNLCLKNGVVGFNTRGPAKGDTIYLAVRIKKDSLCGMRAVLGDATDLKPWKDADKYVSCFMLEHIVYSKPFTLSFLRNIGGKYWSLKYFQGAKNINISEVLAELATHFASNVTDAPIFFNAPAESSTETLLAEEAIQDEVININEVAEVIAEVPDEQISIMGTFQTISFRNETDELRGLEPLVNGYFYDLFPAYPKERTILIPENRLFISSGLEARGERAVSGIKSIPDALLIVYNKKYSSPIEINLIEYECYGEGRTRTGEKSNYMNGQIIPQLMKFASSFSIVTDRQIREETIRKWIEKIIQYVFSNVGLEEKFTAWIRQLEPGLPQAMLALRMNHLLFEAFRSNLKIILIIDELSQEQRDTIRNVIEAFKLDNGSSVQFTAYIVRLGQRINIVDHSAEYSLSVQ